MLAERLKALGWTRTAYGFTVTAAIRTSEESKAFAGSYELEVEEVWSGRILKSMRTCE